jgi:tRNA U55 pseudouridine synthase TruB
MAEGWMYILWSGDADEKIALTSRGKVYEVEVLLGFSTDTGDILGLVNRVGRVANTEAVIIETIHSATSSFVGSFTYPYPKYSSPNIKQTLKAEDIRVKKQNGNIVSVHKISERQVGGQSLLSEIEGRLSLCQMDGDFRLTEISNSWIECLKENGDEFTILKLEITCSSGTYMRTLAEELGRKVGVASLAFSITRTKMIAR